jgi:hypothetical protein
VSSAVNSSPGRAPQDVMFQPADPKSFPGVTGRHCKASQLRSRRSDLTSSRSTSTCRNTNHRNQVTAAHRDGH